MCNAMAHCGGGMVAVGVVVVWLAVSERVPLVEDLVLPAWRKLVSLKCGGCAAGESRTCRHGMPNATSNIACMCVVTTAVGARVQKQVDPMRKPVPAGDLSPGPGAYQVEVPVSPVQHSTARGASPGAPKSRIKRVLSTSVSGAVGVCAVPAHPVARCNWIT